MDRTVQLGVRVPEDLKETLVRMARSEDRSLASLVERALREWLAAQPAAKTTIKPARGKRSS